MYKPWQGLAILSYTNVAAEELGHRLEERPGIPHISYPHFSGTIDSFLNQFIFLPHGGKAMGANRRPKLVGEPHAAWKGRNDPERCFTYIDYLVDGSLQVDAGRIAGKIGRHRSQVESKLSAIADSKAGVNKRGFATQSDANYFAYKVLKENLRLARALALRFPVVVIDEAQDMTEMQHALWDTLIEVGLQNVVLIGDHRQAIYEWNTARPELFVSKFKAWNGTTLDHTFRCSKEICDVLHKISGEAIVPEPSNKNSGYKHQVKVLERSNIESAIKEACYLLAEEVPHSGNQVRLAVLTRGKKDLNAIQTLLAGHKPEKEIGIEKLTGLTRRFLSLVGFVASGNKRQSFRAYETLLKYAGGFESNEATRVFFSEKWNSGSNPSSLGYRKTVLEQIAKIEKLVLLSPASPLLSFVNNEEFVLSGLEPENIKEIEENIAPLKNIPFNALLSAGNESKIELQGQHPKVCLTLSTIHGVKGETFDGVILAINNIGGKCKCKKSSTKHLTVLREHNLLECETKRIFYVAASRAAQLLYFVIESELDQWRELLLKPTSPGTETAIDAQTSPKQQMEQNTSQMQTAAQPTLFE